MRARKKRKIKVLRPVFLCSFYSAFIYVILKILPFLSSLAVLCAGINMPEGAKTVLVSSYKQNKRFYRAQRN